MTNLEKLLSKSSPPLGPSVNALPEILHAFQNGPELFALLKLKNGFYAFESALHIFPLSPDSKAGLEGWNAPSLWRNEYRDLAAGLLFFGEDILQDQFCLSEKQPGVFRFQAETGERAFSAGSIEAWAALIVANFNQETGWPLAHAWQASNGPLPPGKRLMPKIPFILGGEFKLENLWVGDAVEGMRLKGHLAIQTRQLPDGARVKLKTSS